MSGRRRRSIFEEFEQIDRKMDEVFARLFSTEPMWDMRTQALRPLCDIKQTRDSVIVHVDLPYVDRDAIELKVDERSIDLSAELRQPVRYDRWGTTQKGCEFRKLSTTVKLPAEVDPDRAVARFRSGILTVELPRKVEKKRIEVS